MKKHPDWVARFVKVLKLHEGEPFDWATHNCCTLSAELFEATTGQSSRAFFPDLSAKTKRESFRELVKFSKGGLVPAGDKMAEKFGMEKIPPLMAQRGDPVVADFDGEILMATVGFDGRSLVVITPKDGLTYLPVNYAIAAWRIT
tara:strand:- start:2565 stop:2999 length:435 start_codon:yes stop_codon:yes gene_type:complete